MTNKPDHRPDLGTCHWTPNGPTRRTHQPHCTNTTCPGCQPCTHDDLGNPVRHCTARTRCTSHLDQHEHACPGCLTQIRDNLDAIGDLLARIPTEALTGGPNLTEAMSVSGPHADPIDARRRRSLRYITAHIDPDPTDWHDPVIALAEWEYAIRGHLGHDQTRYLSDTITQTRTYLGWVLTDLARTTAPEGSLRILQELHPATHTLRAHLEALLRDQRGSDRGAPCPACATPAPKLQRRWAHWCGDEECHREHDTSGARDTWQCPADPSHWWTEAEYRTWVGEDYVEYADALTASDIQLVYGVRPSTLHAWVSRGKVRKRGRDHQRRILYDVEGVRDALGQSADEGHTSVS